MIENNNIFTASPDMKEEYCAQVVRIGELKPIQGSDFLAQTLVSGTSMVVRKDEFKTGDYAIYCKNETELNSGFLSANNLYEKAEYLRNSNAEKVAGLEKEIKEINERDKTEAGSAKLKELEAEVKSSCGFFNKYGRIKMITLRGIPSFGFLVKLENIALWMPQAGSVDLSKLMLNEDMGIGMDFDTVCGEPFIKAYVPRIKPRVKKARDGMGSKGRKRQKKIEKFERISKEDFMFHYDTNQLASNIWRVNPTDKVTITSKLHGTSGCYANIPVKSPIKLPLRYRFVNWLSKVAAKAAKYLSTKVTPGYVVEYGNVYSTRKVIKNQYINKGVTKGYYGTDVWGEVNGLISPYIAEGMEVFGEICGYLTGSNKMIQKGYDYGCEVGTNFFMPYRIVTTKLDGSKYEWEIQEVREWTENLISEHPQLGGKVRPITILYEGTLSDLYPNIPLTEHWHENVLEAMRKDKGHFHMECNDPTCKSKVPFEGIVLRITGDQIPEAFKLKSLAFLKKEKAATDAGEVDIETANAYGAREEAEETVG